MEQLLASSKDALTKCVLSTNSTYIQAWASMESTSEAAPTGPSTQAMDLRKHLQQTLVMGQAILPQPFYQIIEAKLFKQVSDGFMNVFIGNEAAVKSASQGWWHGYTAYAVVGLQNDVEVISSIIGQLPSCAEETRNALMEPIQFCTLLLKGDPRCILDQDKRLKQFAALKLGRLAAALDHYRDVASSKSFFSKNKSKYPLRRDIETLARDIRAEIQANELRIGSSGLPTGLAKQACNLGAQANRRAFGE